MKKFLKSLLLSPYIILAVILIAGGLLLFTFFPGMRQFFVPKQLKLENTATIITQVNKIAQLFTLNFYDEAVVISKKTVPTLRKGISSGLLGGPIYSRGYGQSIMEEVEQVLIVKAEIKAGFDLSKLDTTAMKVSDKFIFFQLPEVEILEVISNPRDMEVFFEEGEWSFQETLHAHQRGIDLIKQKALTHDILKKSEASAVRVLENFFFLLGFEQVEIRIRQDDAVSRPYVE
jgi:hypothetical protein